MKKRLAMIIMLVMVMFIDAEAGIKGAAAGAGIGAAVGHMVGGNDEAWIGAALGAAGGALIESSNNKLEREVEADNLSRGSYSSSAVITAEPRTAAVVQEDKPLKSEDTWGVRSEEEIRARMEREKANLEAWNNSL